MPAKMQQTVASQIPISEELQQQRSTLVESVSGISLQLEQEDQSRFPVVPNDEIIEINWVRCKQKHEANNTNMADSVAKMVPSSKYRQYNGVFHPTSFG